MLASLYTTEQLETLALDARVDLARGYFTRSSRQRLVEIREELKKRGKNIEVTVVSKYDVVDL